MTQKKHLRNPLHLLSEFVRLESSAGIILFTTAMLALLLSNSPYQACYQNIIHTPIAWHIGSWQFTASTAFWINDVFMAIFFLLVGLEIKREICIGELNSPRKVALPAIAALGGMLIPAGIYFLCNYNDSVALRGWAIPTATDIAFALGILSLLGKRAPIALKFYLMALAIFDDMGAIIIIAFFYQTHLSLPAMAGILACIALLLACNRKNIQSLWVYLLLGVVLWGFFLKSGIHPTLAGVLLALLIPLKNTAPSHALEIKKTTKSISVRLEKALHPWVAYGVLPLFSFANAGVALGGIDAAHLWGTVSVGIMLGLFAGKQIGVFFSTWLAIRLGIASMPKGASCGSLYAIALICGVGFTMSLFIGNIAFMENDTGHADIVRFAVLAGSLLSGAVGYLLLRRCCPQK
jgi:NhaA family Na+:H+ antiporter